MGVDPLRERYGISDVTKEIGVGTVRCGNTLMVAVPADCYGHLGLL